MGVLIIKDIKVPYFRKLPNMGLDLKTVCLQLGYDRVLGRFISGGFMICYCGTHMLFIHGANTWAFIIIS